jgi:hypothetical protein
MALLWNLSINQRGPRLLCTTMGTIDGRGQLCKAVEKPSDPVFVLLVAHGEMALSKMRFVDGSW